MTDSKQHGPEAYSLEGKAFRPANPKELAEAVERAFDYRGDITLTLSSGETIEGYLFNRTQTGSRPFLQIFPKGLPGERVIEILSISFSGKDTASGKSWEAWVEKKESQRQAEAEQAAADAKARGHL